VVLGPPQSHSNVLTNTLVAVCLTLLAYDYTLTLSSEINLVWHSKWNTIKVAFLIQRYLVFVDAVLLGVAAFGRFGPEGVEGCRIVNGLALGKIVFGSTATDFQIVIDVVILGLGMCSSEGRVSYPRLYVSHTLTSASPHTAVILTFRVWAVCGKSDKLKVVLITLYSLCWGSALVVAIIISAKQPRESV
jgi:hypothetical protein